VCGEGGEYESAVFDSLLFKDKRIEIEESEVVVIDDNDMAPVSFLHLKKLKVVEKDAETRERHASKLEEFKQIIQDKRLEAEEYKEEDYSYDFSRAIVDHQVEV